MTALALLWLWAQDPAPVTVYRVGRLIPVASEEIQNAWIAVQAGKIRGFGKADASFAAPAGARVVDLETLVCMPGLVDAGTPADFFGGAAGNEESREITPAVRAVRLVDPASAGFQRLRRLGVTSAAVVPGSRNVIAGLVSVVKTRGATVEAMVLRQDVALAAAMGRDPSTGNFPPRFGTPNLFSRRPTTRMGVVYEFRRAFLDVREHGVDAADPGAAVLARALEGKLPVRVIARHANDIETALDLARELKLRIQIVGAQEAFRLLPALGADRTPIIFQPHLGSDRVAGPEGTEPRLNTFNGLADGGRLVALVGEGDDESQGPLAAGAFAVRYGADRNAVLRALTLGPAQILGVADRVGSVAEGLDADLVFFSGDPLQVSSRVVAVVIDGEAVEGELPKK